MILALVSAEAGEAAPAQSWNSQPSWASQNGATQAKRRQAPPKEPSKAIAAPFAPDTNNIALDLGQVFLMGDLGAKYNDSIGMQLHYTYGVSEMFGFDASFGYSNHADGKYSMTKLLTGLRANLSWYDRVVPYAIFGLGFYKPSIQINETNSASTLGFGVHMGPGIDLLLTNQLFFGASLTFHDMFGSTKATPAGVVDFGGTFTSFLLHTGYAF